MIGKIRGRYMRADLKLLDFLDIAVKHRQVWRRINLILLYPPPATSIFALTIMPSESMDTIMASEQSTPT